MTEDELDCYYRRYLSYIITARREIIDLLEFADSHDDQNVVATAHQWLNHVEQNPDILNLLSRYGLTWESDPPKETLV